MEPNEESAGKLHSTACSENRFCVCFQIPHSEHNGLAF